MSQGDDIVLDVKGLLKIDFGTTLSIKNSREDPLWSSGHDTRLPNGRAVVRIRSSANAFEPKKDSNM